MYFTTSRWHSVFNNFGFTHTECICGTLKFELQAEEGNLLKGTCHVYQITGTCAIGSSGTCVLPSQFCSHFQDYTATLAGKEAGTQYYHHKSCTWKSTWSIGERRVKNHWGRWFESWTQFSRMYYLKKYRCTNTNSQNPRTQGCLCSCSVVVLTCWCFSLLSSYYPCS